MWELGEIAPGAARQLEVAVRRAEPGELTSRTTARARCALPVTESLRTEVQGIAAILLASGARHVQYASTTPYMPDTLAGDDVVPALNKRAAAVAARHSIPVLDLHGVVHEHCGATYSTCALCDNETKYHPGVYCGYHYTGDGYQVLAEAVASSFERLLAPPA